MSRIHLKCKNDAHRVSAFRTGEKEINLGRNIQYVYKVSLGFRKIVARKQIELVTCGFSRP
jgi:hypothetical protein